jgi:CRP/FNR family transcriptional regulator, cyclic AMP receptor protein
MTDRARTKERPLAAILAGTWFGGGLSDAALARLSGLANLREYVDGAIVLREGAAVDDLGVVVAGRVAIRLHVPGRGTRTILTVEPGDVIGWSAIVPPHRSTSTLVAVGSTTVIELDGPALRAALADDPTLAATVLPRAMEAIARRLTATRVQLLDLFAQAEDEPW